MEVKGKKVKLSIWVRSLVLAANSKHLPALTVATFCNRIPQARSGSALSHHRIIVVHKASSLSTMSQTENRSMHYHGGTPNWRPTSRLQS